MKSGRASGSNGCGAAARGACWPLDWTLTSVSMSAPAQKPRPAPVSTITRTAASSAAMRMASRTSRSIVDVQAFSLSGRLSVTTATPS